jgi:hypothetical protein
MSDLTSFLSSVLSEGWMRDQQHASRLYRQDNLYDLAPKTTWIYYVSFKINPAITKYLDPSWYTRYVTNNVIGQLVKSADLPKYTVTTETLNQYNRKTQVQTKLEYQPISITLHDDMANSTNDLWFNYFRYTNADGTYSKPSKGASQYSVKPAEWGNTKYDTMPNRYGFDPEANEPFFDNITIYLLNKQRYLSFTLVNPIIKEWRHGEVDQTQANKLLDSRMTVVYETVLYGKGHAGTMEPAFNKNHYDKTPSPLSIAGGGAANLFGAGGVVAGATGIFGEGGSLASASSPWDYAKVAIQTANLAKNVSNLNSKASINEVLGLGVSAITGAAQNIRSGQSPTGGGLQILTPTLNNTIQASRTSVTGK